jgi:hypothetical protein
MPVSDDVAMMAEKLELKLWPADIPFPLTDAECALLCRGYPVRWPGLIDEVLDLPGRYELLDGWLIQKR